MNLLFGSIYRVGLYGFDNLTLGDFHRADHELGYIV